jgi:xanthine dehydrogenase accessory factor
VALLYVVESRGSSPGRRGFHMVVNAVGEMEGSIGGGIMEHKLTEMLREQLRRGEGILSLRRQVHDKEAVRDQSGMICSGEQLIFLYSFREEDVVTVRRLLDSLLSYGHGWLRFSPAGMEFLQGGEGIAPGAGPVGGMVSGVSLVEGMVSGESWMYQERTGYRDRLYIVGGGHCALALSQLARGMDFYITLFDDRSGLGSLDRNGYVHEKVLLESYAGLSGQITGGEHCYVVVMTQGYRTDDIAVRVLLPMDFRYFGLLGSSAKIGKMLAQYREEGMVEERLGRLRAPAGLAIHSQTPEEIAVSIIAEMIRVRNG